MAKIKKHLLLRTTGIAIAFALVGVACSTGQEAPGAQRDNAMESPKETPAGQAATGIDTDAAQLTQGLTDLLDSHVYLAGIAVEQAVLTEDPNSPQFKAAAAALDQNSQDLAAAIESVYGADAADQFLELWRKHIGFFVDYTVGGITDDQQAQRKAKQALDRYRQDFGAFIDSATNGELPKDAVAGALQEHVNSLLKTIDSVIEGKGNPFMSLYDASHMHMPGTASALAGGIIAANPDKF
ncbi:MAG: hypothetical protein ACRDJL_07690 [Actinomycetota bacterium]